MHSVISPGPEYLRGEMAMGAEVRVGEKASRGEAKASPPKKTKWKGQQQAGVPGKKRCLENH